MKTRIVVALEGGMVEAIVSDKELPFVSVAVIDYDIEGVPKEELTTINALKGDRQYLAYIIKHRIEKAGINLDGVFGKKEEKEGPVCKHLDASTAHITQDDSKILEDNYNLGIRVLSDEYGFFISLAVFMDEEAKEYIKKGASRELSHAFFKLVDYAIEKGCDYINLDKDAEVISVLPTFDW